MDGTDGRETARIYDLAAFRRRRLDRPVNAPVKVAPVRGVGGGAWYHEAAIHDEDRTPRRP